MKLFVGLAVTAGDEQRTLMLQMAAYYNNARVAAVNKTNHNNCAAVATPDTPAATKHVVMETPSMHDVAAAAAAAVDVAKPLADVTDAAGSHGDASDEPSEARSLLTSAADRQLHQYQRQTI